LSRRRVFAIIRRSPDLFKQGFKIEDTNYDQSRFLEMNRIIIHNESSHIDESSKNKSGNTANHFAAWKKKSSGAALWHVRFWYVELGLLRNNLNPACYLEDEELKSAEQYGTSVQVSPQVGLSLQVLSLQGLSWQDSGA
jgi:hypothetical protein